MPAATLAPPTRSEVHPPRTAARLRIAYLTTEYPKVSHTFVRREITELERRGHEVVRLSIRPSGKVVDPADKAEAERTSACLSHSRVRLLADAARWAVTRPSRFAGAARVALRLNRRSDRGLVRHAAYLVEAAFLAGRLRAAGVNHVHCHFGTNAAAVALLMKKLAGITYSLTIHGPGEFDAPIGLSLREKVSESEFTAAISHFGKAQLRRWVAPEHWDKIRVVRCTVNPDFLKPPAPIDPDSDRFVSVGRLTAQKEPLRLVEAFAGLVREGLPGRLVFAGDGELRGAVEAEVKRHGLGDRVRITGWLSERGVRDEIRAARALVLPSSAEGLPVVIMEALAMGRPVVSTFTAGIPELVRPGENGWLVPCGDAEALATALRGAVTAPVARLQEMGLAGRALVIRQHHPETEADKLEDLFLRRAR